MKIKVIKETILKFEEKNKVLISGLNGYQLFLCWFMDYLMDIHTQIRFGLKVNTARFYAILHDTADKICATLKLKHSYILYVGPSYINYCIERITYHLREAPEINDECLKLGLNALQSTTYLAANNLTYKAINLVPLYDEVTMIRLIQLYHYFYNFHPTLKDDIYNICSAIQSSENGQDFKGISTSFVRSLDRYKKIAEFFNDHSIKFNHHFNLNRINALGIESTLECVEIFPTKFDKDLSTTILTTKQFLHQRENIRLMQMAYSANEEYIRDNLQSFEKKYKKQIESARRETGII